jgi:hypothetical protein
MPERAAAAPCLRASREYPGASPAMPRPPAQETSAAAAALEALERASAPLRAAGLWVFVGLPPAAAGHPAQRAGPAPAKPQSPQAPKTVTISRALRELVVAVRVTDPAENRSDDVISAEARDFLTSHSTVDVAGARALRDKMLADWKAPGSLWLTGPSLVQRIEDAASSPGALATFNKLYAAARRAKVARPGLAVLCHVGDLKLARPADRRRLERARIDWAKYGARS